MFTMSSGAREDDVELSIVIEAASDPIEDNDVIVDNDDCDVAEDDEVVLQLTVEAEPPYCSTEDNEWGVEPSGCPNTSLSVSQKPLPRTTLSRQAASAVAAAQAKVFRQYLLDGDTEAKVAELDNSSSLRGKGSVWGKLAMQMYGDCDRRLLQRMYVAWRRRRHGSVRDRVLSSLYSEGIISHPIPGFAAISHPVNSRNGADVENHSGAPIRNCCSLSNNVVRLRRKISHENCVCENGLDVCSNAIRLESDACQTIHHRLQQDIFKHESVVSSGSLKVTCEPLMSRHPSVLNQVGDVTTQEKCQHTKLISGQTSTDKQSCCLLPQIQQTSDGTSDLELDDVDIQKAIDILKVHFPSVAGLEHVGLGTCVRGRSVPRFAAAGSRRFVQIVNVGDHWVCATNLFGATACDVYVYDSLFSHVSQSLVVQISSILRLDNSSSSITFHIREFKQQKPGTRWCGYYAVAAAFAVCQGADPTGTVYSVELLHSAVKEHLETGSFGHLPATNCKLKRDVQTLMKQRLFCVCQKRAMGEMLRCERCYNQFHASCIAAFRLPLASDGHLERGPCCAHVTDTS